MEPKRGCQKKNLLVLFEKSNTKNITGNSIDNIDLIAKRPKDMRLNSEKLENDLGIKLSNLKDEIKSIKDEYNK